MGDAALHFPRCNYDSLADRGFLNLTGSGLRRLSLIFKISTNVENAIAMKMMLSIPSTISSALSVSSAIQMFGSKSQLISSCPFVKTVSAFAFPASGRPCDYTSGCRNSETGSACTYAYPTSIPQTECVINTNPPAANRPVWPQTIWHRLDSDRYKIDAFWIYPDRCHWFSTLLLNDLQAVKLFHNGSQCHPKPPHGAIMAQ